MNKDRTMNMNMNSVIVLGVGNRLMGDDGIGNDVAEELDRRNAFPGLRIIAGETDVDYCMDELEGAGRVIIIDAASTGAEPCSVTAISLEDALQELPLSFSSHHFNLLQYLKQHNREKGLMIAIEVCSVQWRIGLSPEMENQFSRIVEEVLPHIETCLGL